MKKMRWAVIIILTLALAAGGCGQSQLGSSVSDENYQYSEPQSAKSESYDYGGAYSGAASAGEYEDFAMEEASDAAYGEAGADMDEGAPLSAGKSTENSDNTLQQAQDGQKIVYTGDMSIQTLEYDKSYSSIHAKIKEYGGFIESEYESDNDYNWYNNSGSSSSNKRRLNITARIPSEKFESFMNSLSGDGKVVSRNMNAENISQVYADTQTYKEALEKEQKRLLEMMDKAETIEDMITVESRLSEVERQLNQYKTRLSTMDKQVQYSTISINLEEVKRYSQQVQERTFAEEVQIAFADAITSFRVFCEGLVLFVVRYFPYLIILLIVILLIVYAARKARAKRLAMMMDPEYAKMMNAKQRAKAEKLARKQAQKMAKKQGTAPAPAAAAQGQAAAPAPGGVQTPAAAPAVSGGGQPPKRVYKRVDYTAQEAAEQTETAQAKADQTATAQTADPEAPNNAETDAKADDAGEQD